MLSSEHGEFQKTIRKLAGVFDRAINAELMEAYWNALRDVPLSTLRARADTAIRTSKYFPKPRDLRENPDGNRISASTFDEPPIPDGPVAMMNRNLLAFLMARGFAKKPVDGDKLAALVAYKNHVAKQLEDGKISDAEWVEMKSAVHAEFERLAT